MRIAGDLVSVSFNQRMRIDYKYCIHLFAWDTVSLFFIFFTFSLFFSLLKPGPTGSGSNPAVPVLLQASYSTSSRSSVLSGAAGSATLPTDTYRVNPCCHFKLKLLCH